LTNKITLSCSASQKWDLLQKKMLREIPQISDQELTSKEAEEIENKRKQGTISC